MLAGAAGSVDFQSDAQMIRPNLAPVQQAAQQWVLRANDRMERSGAIERISETLAPAVTRSPPTIRDLDTRVGLARRLDAAGNHLKLAVRNHPRDRIGNFRRDAVSVNVPPGARMAEEAPLLRLAEALPKRVAVRTQAVDRRAPADLGAPFSEPAEHCAKAARQLFLLDRRRVEIGVRTRDETAARKSDDPVPVPSGIERQHEVDHSEAGPHQESGAAGPSEVVDRRSRIYAPRIADETTSNAGEGAKTFWFLVADGQD